MADQPNPCFNEKTGEEDHTWVYISDWYGDPTIPNGTADCSRWECTVCGSEDCDREPPEKMERWDYD